MKVVAYIRVSTSKQDEDAQRLEILEYANREGLRIEKWVSMEISSRRSMDERGITALLADLQQGDMLVVSELSRLGRSMPQVVQIINDLVAGKVCLRSIKEGFRLLGTGEEMSISDKVTVGLFSLMAEIDRDLISQRTKAGLAAARARGKRLGPSPGPRRSILDDREAEIRGYLEKGVSKASIAKILGVSKSTLQWFVSIRMRWGQDEK